LLVKPILIVYATCQQQKACEFEDLKVLSKKAVGCHLLATNTQGQEGQLSVMKLFCRQPVAISQQQAV
jgi:hypothetical protein